MRQHLAASRAFPLVRCPAVASICGPVGARRGELGGSYFVSCRSAASGVGNAGSIGDLFTTLGAKPPVLEDRFAQLKEQLRPAAGDLAAAWRRLEAAIDAEAASIRQVGSSIVPSIDFAEIDVEGGRFPPGLAAAVRKRGCVVVRNVLDENLALAMKEGTKEYIGRNRMHLTGFPPDRPQVWEAYWSQPQAEMRQHPNMLKTQTALNRLWHCRSLPGKEGAVAVDVHRPATYSERLRIRQPGDTSFTLGPHMDGGSVERWEDDEYRAVYSSILSCDWESYDAWDATHRATAQCDLYNLNIGLCTIFRSFQGWLSLSRSGTGNGALMVLPMLQEATAFLMLRPFLEDVPASSFCGANPGKTQDLFPEFHGPLIESMVPMPDVKPGDTVWWHCDLIHAVEAAHAGSEDSSVYYVPSAPLCLKNAKYLRKQALRFREGRTPPDFPPNDSEVRCEGRCTESDLSDLGLRAMGLSGIAEERVEGEPECDFVASLALREECRQVLRQGIV